MKLTAIIWFFGCLGLLCATVVPRRKVIKGENDLAGIGSEKGDGLELNMDEENSVNEDESWKTYRPAEFPNLRISEDHESRTYDTGMVTYTFFTRRTDNFTNAEHFCRSRCHGGHLASIHNYHINHLLTRLTTSNGHSTRVWIGGMEIFRSRRWVWTDGTPWNYSRWLHSWPRYYVNACVELNWNVAGTWSDHSCNIHKNMVCEH